PRKSLDEPARLRIPDACNTVASRGDDETAAPAERRALDAAVCREVGEEATAGRVEDPHDPAGRERKQKAAGLAELDVVDRAARSDGTDLALPRQAPHGDGPILSSGSCEGAI